jgi:alanine-glyoxylate transaminase/serine-glyoxylate transaminase/serine-pyruvate transaminase
VTAVEQEWGRAVDAGALASAAHGKKYDVVCCVHAETSTGVLQPIEPIKQLADQLGALLLVDAVTSLGGVPVHLDHHGVDAAYSGTQKCLSCPPGLAPISLSPRARRKLEQRKRPVQSWYLDLSLVTRYFGGERAYHHTAPINQLYALHESLRLVLDEGLEARFQRHALASRALTAGLRALGLELPVPESERLTPLTLVAIPDGVDDARVRRSLLGDYGLEIGGGLGKFKGNAWRIGLMGASATRRNVAVCLGALGGALASQGFKPKGDALAAAAEVFSSGSGSASGSGSGSASASRSGSGSGSASASASRSGS